MIVVEVTREQHRAHQVGKQRIQDDEGVVAKMPNLYLDEAVLPPPEENHIKKQEANPKKMHPIDFGPTWMLDDLCQAS